MVTIDTLLAGDWDMFWSAVRHMLLPSLVIGVYSMALISRMMMRSSMLEVVRQTTCAPPARRARVRRSPY